MPSDEETRPKTEISFADLLNELVPPSTTRDDEDEEDEDEDEERDLVLEFINAATWYVDQLERHTGHVLCDGSHLYEVKLAFDVALQALPLEVQLMTLPDHARWIWGSDDDEMSDDDDR